MHLTALGHSALLLDWDADGFDVPTRILVDPWLSDYCVGDLFGRWPRVRWTAQSLGPVHGVFLSHAHTDHLDPYTLVQLWRELPDVPTLILPRTLRFLEPLFNAHLPGVEIAWLGPRHPVELRGVQLHGRFAPAAGHTNEDDVMVLIAQAGPEVVLVEADCRIDVRDPAQMRAIYRMFTRKGIESAAWLTTENELDASLPMAGCEDFGDGFERSLEGMASVEVDADVLYTDVARPSPWSLRHLTRAIHGQGLTPPPEVDPRWQELLYPVRVEDRVRIETRIAQERGWAHRVRGLRPGFVYHLGEGELQELGPTSAVQVLDAHDPRGFRAMEEGAPQRPQGPVRPGLRDVHTQEARLLDVLNHRLIPFLVGMNAPPIHLFLEGLGGAYRLRLHYGDPEDGEARDYVLETGASAFRRSHEPGRPYESYWANDLEDRLDGVADEFTPFFRAPLPDTERLLGHCLSLPVLGYDLCLRKIQLHFERAVRGETAASWVRSLIR